MIGIKPTFDDLVSELYTICETPWEPLIARAKVLYEFARDQKEGIIVELGTYLGYGAFSLAFGALAGNNPAVYTVDDYAKRTGWAGEMYSLVDEKKFYKNWNNIKRNWPINLFHIRDSAETSLKLLRGIGLLYVDVSPPIDVVPMLDECMMSGGIVLFRDTLTRSLGYDKQVARAVEGDRWEIVESQRLNDYFMAIKKKQ